MPATLISDEAARLAAVRQCNILDTLPEAAFDDLARLAAQICGTPIALISLIDANRHWFKSKVGWDAPEVPRAGTFCDYVIRQADMLIIPEALCDARFARSPLVLADPYVQFYAGVPLRTAQGHVLGTLCVMDRVARQIRPEQVAALQVLGRQIVAQLELKRHIAERERTEEALHAADARFRILVEQIPAITYIAALDEMSTTLYVSPQIESILGFSPAEWTADPQLWIRQLHPNDRERVLAEAAQSYVSGNPPPSEYRMFTRDGRVVWFRNATMLVRDEAGHTLFMQGVSLDITERKRAEEALRESEERYRSLVQTSPDAITLTSLDGVILFCNQQAARLHGYERIEELLGKQAWEFIALEDRQHALDNLQRTLELGRISNVEYTLIKQDGAHFPAELSVTVVADAVGQPTALMAIMRDITERKRLQAQFLQSQKMESIGRLAGGIAHDFNNLLTVISGSADLALQELPPEAIVRCDLIEIQKAADRAGSLTRQLLTFARKQVIEPRSLNLSSLILDMDKLLRRVIGADVELITLPASDLGWVKADPGQIEQVIVNLAVNARDAMPEGGKLIIETTNVVLDQDYARKESGVPAGAYVLLAVTDTGVGMSRETQQHIFEPFFTTKDLSKGTGLGLSICYGIVKQHGGHIAVYSEEHVGTTFKVYLPLVADNVAAPPKHADDPRITRGTETILLVEDEPAVRALAAHVLRRQGYTLLEARNGEEALRLVEQRDGKRIDLLLTDMVMPYMGGKALAERLTMLCPSLKVLFMSGYTGNTVIHDRRLDAGYSFLQKPFSVVALARKVRAILDGPDQC